MSRLLNQRLALLATLHAFRREFPPASAAVAAGIPLKDLRAEDVLKRAEYGELRDRALEPVLDALTSVLEDPRDEALILAQTAKLDRAIAKMSEIAHQLVFLKN